MPANDELLTGMLICYCGQPAEVVIPTNPPFETWIDEINAPGPISGFYSCSTPGCSGNIKEFLEKRLKAMQKLTDEEKQILGLWYYPQQKEPEVEKNAFGRWLGRLFHV